MPTYATAQLAGALALRTIFGPIADAGATAPAGSVAQSLVLEPSSRCF